jgi:NADPH-dependent 2,4-dienoyl-CoA reductase/sulfur reductase-like enzyme
MSPADGDATDIAVIGAGPAGLSAALRAAGAGLRVTLLDEQAEAGGAGWRGLAGAARAPGRVLQDDRAGRDALAALAASSARHIRGASVWDIDHDGVIAFSAAGAAARLSARRIILAPGALERPMPFPGWTLPGVLTAGAVQIMLKTAGLAPPAPLVMAGSGPLLWLVAAQLAEAGAPPAALVETRPRGALARALPHLRPGARAAQAARAALHWEWRLRRAGVAIHRERDGAGGRGRRGGRPRCASWPGAGGARSAARRCSIHAGLAPNTQITRALGLAHDWDPALRLWRPRVDAMGRTGREAVLIAGDGAGVAGAEAAALSGRLAALAALDGLAAVAPAEIAETRAAHARACALRPFLDRLDAPSEAFLDPADAVDICRCEGATAGAVRALVAEGRRDVNEIKALSRAGMGPCQGRFCALTLGEVVARAAGAAPDAPDATRQRAPFRPVTLAELASLAPEAGDARG